MKKKILFFTTSGNYNGGGVMCLVETLKYIDREAIDPYVVIPNSGTTEVKLKELKIPYYIIRSYDWLFPEKILHSFSFKCKRPIQLFVNIIAEIRVYYILKSGKFDAYHLNSLYSNFGVKAAFLLNIPVFWHLREFVDENPWTSSFIKEGRAYEIISKSHKLIAVSNCVKDFYKTKMPNSIIDVVYDGVDLVDQLEKREIINFHHPLKLSMIGGVTEVKGHEDALNSVYLLKLKGFDSVLTIYGRIRDHKYANHLIEIIKKLGIESNVVFAGNKTDMQEVYNNTDLVLVCSRSESFGRVAVEAMYQNIPVIGADNTGTSELIKGNPMSILYKTGDANDLYRKIRDMANRQFDDKDLQDNHRHVMHFSSEESARNLTTALLD